MQGKDGLLLDCPMVGGGTSFYCPISGPGRWRYITGPLEAACMMKYFLRCVLVGFETSGKRCYTMSVV